MNKTGLFYAILTAMVWGLAPVFDKFAMQHIGPKPALIVRNTVIFFATIPFLFFFFRDIRYGLMNLNLKVFIALSIAGIIGGVIGIFIYMKSLKLMEASRVVPICSTYPLFAMLLAWVLLGEKITLAKAGGTIMVVIGLILISI